MNNNKQEKEEDNDEENDEDSSKKMVYLYQDDFTEGTYRILESGTYIIMEDIVFDFNSGTGNEIGAWLPHNDQANLYPGAEDNHWRDPYFMGFFAGITVECDNVVIDLNGKTLSQSIEFYYQQRWFSLIELSSQPFLASQGPGFFGPSPVFSTNVEIFNGRLGLTAHHGIHGMCCACPTCFLFAFSFSVFSGFLFCIVMSHKCVVCCFLPFVEKNRQRK